MARTTSWPWTPKVRFPRFRMETGDETIASVRLIDSGPDCGLWQWSMTVSLPGPAYGSPISGRETSRGAVGWRTFETDRHDLSTRPEQSPRRPSEVQGNHEG
jgi:hypothetical protein